MLPMKIKTVSLSWFRGSAQQAILDTHSKSIVVYGPNGSGKSTFPDAFEYFFRNGKINHLSHEYSGKKQEKGVRNTHAGKNVSELVFTFEDNNKAIITINEDGTCGLIFEPEEFKDLISKCEADRIILRQDEVADFVNSTKGNKYSVLLPLLGLSELEVVAENFLSIQKILAEESQLQKNKQRYRDLMEDVNKILPSFEEKEIQTLINNIGKRYLGIIPKEHTELVEKLSVAIDENIQKAKSEIEKNTILKQIIAENLIDKLNDLIKNQEKSSRDVDSLLGCRLEVLEKSSTLIEELNEEDKIICPSCGQEIDGTKYVAHIKSELERLKEVQEIYQKAKQSRILFSNSIKQVFKKIEVENISKWLDLELQKELKVSFKKIYDLKIDELPQSFTSDKVSFIKSNLDIITALIRKEIEKTPPTIEELVKDNETISLIKKIPEIKTLDKKIKKITSLIGVLKRVEKSIRQELKEKTQLVIGRISSDVMSMWSTLHPDKSVEDIHLSIPDSTDKGIDICLKFHGVDQLSPRLTLSEGHRNSLGLCIFLTLAKDNSYSGQPIILDDIITSLDREHRSFVADLLINNFSGRQILLFTHDREWFSELRYRLPEANWKFMKLNPWENPEIGLQWVESYRGFDEATSLLSRDASSAGNKVRGIMDTDLSIIAEKLGIRLSYARGDRNDHRGAVEFLEEITSEAEKDKRFRIKESDSSSYIVYSEPITIWKTTKSLLIPWANRASHDGYITRVEVEKLIDMCKKSLEYFKCPNCNEFVWILDKKSAKRFQCSCGNLQWRHN